MPILPAEPDIFPHDLWEGEGPLLDVQRPWWCLHTKPRQEKATARHLRSRGISHYLPQVVREDRTPNGRKIRSIIPLFPGYMFLLGDDHERVEALRSNHLVKVLEVGDQSSLVRDLHQIH